MNQSNALVVVQNLVAEARGRFNAVSVDRSVTFEREASFATQILMASEFALKTAMGAPQSVINAVCNVSAIGITLNPAKRQAYLVPRDGRICLDIGYIGLLDMAIEGGGIVWAQSDVVRASDTFTLHGVDQQPTHTRQPFSPDRGEIVGAYVVAKTAGGDYLTTCMDISELHAIRDRTAAWKSGKSTPWKTDPGEMCKKTVIKRAAKTWPKSKASDRLERAIHYLNTEGDEGLESLEEPLDRPRDFGLSPQRAKTIRSVAGAAIQKFDEGNEWGAYEEVTAITDNDEKLALWAVLKPHSALRSAIKRMADAERSSQPATETEKT